MRLIEDGAIMAKYVEAQHEWPFQCFGSLNAANWYAREIEQLVIEAFSAKLAELASDVEEAINETQA